MTLSDTLAVRTRYEGPTDTHCSRIVVSAVIGGKRVQRTLPLNYAASNAHVAAVIEYLHAMGFEAFRADYVRETRSGRGNIYRVAY